MGPSDRRTKKIPVENQRSQVYKDREQEKKDKEKKPYKRLRKDLLRKQIETDLEEDSQESLEVEDV